MVQDEGFFHFFLRRVGIGQAAYVPDDWVHESTRWMGKDLEVIEMDRLSDACSLWPPLFSSFESVFLEKKSLPIMHQ